MLAVAMMLDWTGLDRWMMGLDGWMDGRMDGWIVSRVGAEQ